MRMSPKDALGSICHTSERRFGCVCYTLADRRFPLVNGREITATLVHGETRFRWDLGDGEDSIEVEADKETRQ